MTWRVVAPLVVVMAALGALFGSAEVVTIALADEQHAARRSGPLLALFAGGSLVAGVITGAVSWRRGPADRLVLGTLGLTVAFVPIPWIHQLPLLGGWLLLCGLAVSPALIATVSLVEQVAPPRRLTEALGVLHTGLAAGVALGAGLAGSAVDRFGASPAYLVTVLAALLSAAAAWVTRRNA